MRCHSHTPLLTPQKRTRSPRSSRSLRPVRRSLHPQHRSISSIHRSSCSTPRPASSPGISPTIRPDATPRHHSRSFSLRRPQLARPSSVQHQSSFSTTLLASSSSASFSPSSSSPSSPSSSAPSSFSSSANSSSPSRLQTEYHVYSSLLHNYQQQSHQSPVSQQRQRRPQRRGPIVSPSLFTRTNILQSDMPFNFSARVPPEQPKSITLQRALQDTKLNVEKLHDMFGDLGSKAYLSVSAYTLLLTISAVHTFNWLDPVFVYDHLIASGYFQRSTVLRPVLDACLIGHTTASRLVFAYIIARFCEPVRIVLAATLARFQKEKKEFIEMQVSNILLSENDPIKQYNRIKQLLHYTRHEYGKNDQFQSLSVRELFDVNDIQPIPDIHAFDEVLVPSKPPNRQEIDYIGPNASSNQMIRFFNRTGLPIGTVCKAGTKPIIKEYADPEDPKRIEYIIVRMTRIDGAEIESIRSTSRNRTSVHIWCKPDPTLDERYQRVDHRFGPNSKMFLRDKAKREFIRRNGKWAMLGWDEDKGLVTDEFQAAYEDFHQPMILPQSLYDQDDVEWYRYHRHPALNYGGTEQSVNPIGFSAKERIREEQMQIENDKEKLHPFQRLVIEETMGLAQATNDAATRLFEIDKLENAHLDFLKYPQTGRPDKNAIVEKMLDSMIPTDPRTGSRSGYIFRGDEAVEYNQQTAYEFINNHRKTSQTQREKMPTVVAPDGIELPVDPTKNEADLEKVLGLHKVPRETRRVLQYAHRYFDNHAQSDEAVRAQLEFFDFAIKKQAELQALQVKQTPTTPQTVEAAAAAAAPTPAASTKHKTNSPSSDTPETSTIGGAVPTETPEGAASVSAEVSAIFNSNFTYPPASATPSPSSSSISPSTFPPKLLPYVDIDPPRPGEPRLFVPGVDDVPDSDTMTEDQRMKSIFARYNDIKMFGLKLFQQGDKPEQIYQKSLQRFPSAALVLAESAFYRKQSQGGQYSTSNLWLDHRGQVPGGSSDIWNDQFESLFDYDLKLEQLAWIEANRPANLDELSYAAQEAWNLRLQAAEASGEDTNSGVIVQQYLAQLHAKPEYDGAVIFDEKTGKYQARDPRLLETVRRLESRGAGDEMNPDTFILSGSGADGVNRRDRLSTAIGRVNMRLQHGKTLYLDGSVAPPHPEEKPRDMANPMNAIGDPNAWRSSGRDPSRAIGAMDSDPFRVAMERDKTYGPLPSLRDEGEYFRLRHNMGQGPYAPSSIDSNRLVNDQDPGAATIDKNHETGNPTTAGGGLPPPPPPDEPVSYTADDDIPTDNEWISERGELRRPKRVSRDMWDRLGRRARKFQIWSAIHSQWPRRDMPPIQPGNPHPDLEQPGQPGEDEPPVFDYPELRRRLDPSPDREEIDQQHHRTDIMRQELAFKEYCDKAWEWWLRTDVPYPKLSLMEDPYQRRLKINPDLPYDNNYFERLEQARPFWTLDPGQLPKPKLPPNRLRDWEHPEMRKFFERLQRIAEVEALIIRQSLKVFFRNRYVLKGSSGFSVQRNLTRDMTEYLIKMRYYQREIKVWEREQHLHKIRQQAHKTYEQEIDDLLYTADIQPVIPKTRTAPNFQYQYP